MAVGFLEALIMVILAIIFPPLPVLLETGCSGSLLLNILLTILGWLPGVLHALYVIFASGPSALAAGGNTYGQQSTTTTTRAV